LGVIGGVVFLVVLLVLFWNWDWFLPIVESKASASLGRKVTASHLHVRLGRVTTVVLDDVSVAEPDGFSDKRPVATVKHLTVAVGVLDYVRGQGLVVPRIDVDGADADIVARADGSNNYTFKFMEPSKTPAKNSGTGPKIGVLTIEDSRIDVDMAKLKAKMHLDVHTTQDASDANKNRIVVAAKGTYAAQPITGNLVAGALLSLRDKAAPYPIDLQVANGATRVSLVGTVQDPLKFSGADLRLVFQGQDMAQLYALTGIPIPTTPPYRVAGHLDYTKARIVFRDFEGKLGSSDLGGTIAVDPAAKPISVDANLHSHAVNLVDLGGFIGASPGHAAENKAAHQGTPAVPRKANVLPTAPISLPKLNAANVVFNYRGDRIEGKFVPLDNIVVSMTIENGVIDLKKIVFGVGSGQLDGKAVLSPASGKALKADASVTVRNVDLSHLLNSTHAFHGRGIVGGGFKLQGTGDSIAGLVGHGSGGVELYMRDGGNIASLLPDLLGLEFTNAILSALGVPQRTNVDCFVASMPLKDGVLDTRLFVLQTGEARTTGTGSVDFRNDTINYALTTRSTGFSVGSLPGPIDIGGSLASPSIKPGGEIIGRGAATLALGILAAPLAILPTIQFGVGKSKACEEAVGGTVGGSGAGPAPAAVAAPVKHRTPVQVHKAWERRLHHGG
jgi:uncharacterized protein involved in outer membrane biogenesis